jgi:hypothetical protein
MPPRRRAVTRNGWETGRYRVRVPRAVAALRALGWLGTSIHRRAELRGEKHRPKTLKRGMAVAGDGR